MKILHLKAEAGGVTSGRRAKYESALREAGHEVDCWSVTPRADLVGLSRYDVVHIHNAPDAFALKWLRHFAQIHPARRPGIVIDIDDDMGKLCRELGSARQHEIDVCAEQLRRCCGCLPTIVASPAWSVPWHGNVVRNYVPENQKSRSVETRSATTRIAASVYVGRRSRSWGFHHHRNPDNWLSHPDAVLSSVPAVDLVAAISMFRVGLIPFFGSSFTETFEPHKLFEYLAAGVTIDVPGRLAQCVATIDEFSDHKPHEMPTFESQLPLIEAIYEDAQQRRSSVDIPLQ